MIELISLHIPKTAGTSFRNTLTSVYGGRGVVRVDIAGHSHLAAPADCSSDSGRRIQPAPAGRFPDSFIAPLLNSYWFNYIKWAIWHTISPRRAGASPNLNPAPPDVLPPEARVIHGHFRYAHLLEKYELDRNIPVITWLRDPVERVISNYFYLHKVLHEAMELVNAPLDVLNRMERSLIEYAQLSLNCNRMSKFLKDLDLSELRFVGIVEHMEEDLSDLAKLLGWPAYETYFHNTGKDRKMMVGQTIRDEIAEFNRQDVELYEQALRLRHQRRREIRS